ncbi:hypothetical protein ACOSP6_02010 [Tenacibaculum sp. MEBiC06402]|uniref:hypothetical protein n=1 Tax=unclassified Tenacibaculum TaxID=2635139 RepID=UPI003B9A9827
MKNKIKNTLLILTSILTLYFGYSIFERPSNIEEDVYYNINPYLSEFQVLHSTKTFGTNYAILGKFDCKNDSIKKAEFKIANFGGPVNFYLKKVTFHPETDFFTFDIGVSLFSKEDTALTSNCSFVFKSGEEYDSHIKIHTLFWVIDETNYLENKPLRDKWCCGRMCRYMYTPEQTN